MNDTVPSSAQHRSIDLASRPMLDHLALLEVRGADARSFLDNQLTRNVPMLEAGAEGSSTLASCISVSRASVSRASVAGYCSPKGRLLATFVVWCELSPQLSSGSETIFLLTSRDIAEMVAKRLRMYVLRAKVTIEDVTATHAIEGFHDSSSLSAAPPTAPFTDVDSLDPWAVLCEGEARWIHYPDVAADVAADADGLKRWMRIAPDAGDAHGTLVDAPTWRWSEIRAGIPHITATTQDRFVPQMVNLEALGGVDFKKGCFPGQEVVARSQYLGKLKRRMALASIDDSDESVVPQPATDVWSAQDNGPVGLVVNAERGTDGRMWLLVEIPLAHFESHALRLGRSDGAALKIESLPYQLPDNEVFVRPKL